MSPSAIGMLNKFCMIGFRGDRDFSSPWSEGGFTYATNGSVILRVERIPEVTRANPGLNVGVLDFCDREGSVNWWAGQNLVASGKVEQCDYCNGTARRPLCPDCGGRGDVYYRSKSGHEYLIDCPVCDDDIVFMGGCTDGVECSRCRGSGFVCSSGKYWENIKIGGSRVALPLVHIVSQLPGVMFEVSEELVDRVRFVFDGGAGVVMGLSPKTVTTDGGES